MTRPIEPLESRCLLSSVTGSEPAQAEVISQPRGSGNVTLRFRRGELTIRGDARGNAVYLAPHDSGRGVLVGGFGNNILPHGRNAPPVGTRVNGRARPVWVRRSVEAIRVELRGGDDWLQMAGTLSSVNPLVTLRFDGGEGADEVRVRNMTIGSVDVAASPGGGEAGAAGDRVLFEHASVGGILTIAGSPAREQVVLRDSTFYGPVTVDTGPGPDYVFTGRTEGSVGRSVYAAGLTLTSPAGEDEVVDFAAPGGIVPVA